MRKTCQKYLSHKIELLKRHYEKEESYKRVTQPNRETKIVLESVGHYLYQKWFIIGVVSVLERGVFCCKVVRMG